MSTARTLVGDAVLRWEVRDAELEAAADEMALSYTIQTSEYYPCCQ